MESMVLLAERRPPPPLPQPSPPANDGPSDGDYNLSSDDKLLLTPVQHRQKRHIVVPQSEPLPAWKRQRLCFENHDFQKLHSRLYSPPKRRSKTGGEESLPCTAKKITQRATTLFPSIDCLSKPCVSSRLFACYTLVAEKSHQCSLLTKLEENIADDSQSTNCEKGFRTGGTSSLGALEALLNAWVKVESISLQGEQVHSSKEDGKDISSASSTRVVQFSGFDCSSTKPAVDSQLGSHAHYAECIRAMVDATQQIRALTLLVSSKEEGPPGPVLKAVHQNTTFTPQKPGITTRRSKTTPRRRQKQSVIFSESKTYHTRGSRNRVVVEQSQSVVSPSTRTIQLDLADLIEFLQSLSCIHSPLREECAKSISTHYPQQRLLKAIQIYKHDLEIILARCRRQDKTCLEDLNNSDAFCDTAMLPRTLTSDTVLPKMMSATTTFCEFRLAEFVGQAIRFHMRKLFNPSYAMEDNNNGINGSMKRHSRVFSMIELRVLGGEGRDTAVMDGSISSLLSMALQRLYEYFGDHLLVLLQQKEQNSDDDTKNGSHVLENERLQHLWPEHFLASMAFEKLMASTPRSSTKLSQEEAEDLINTIVEAKRFVVAFGAGRFLLELLQCPGVCSEVQALNGWDQLKGLAKILHHDDQLSDLCWEDAHFALLMYLPQELLQVDRLTKAMKPIVDDIESQLTKLRKKLSSFNRRSKYASLSKSLGIPSGTVNSIRESLDHSLFHPFPNVVPAST